MDEASYSGNLLETMEESTNENKEAEEPEHTRMGGIEDSEQSQRNMAVCADTEYGTNQ